MSAARTGRMPALFLGHGNPMNAITETPYSVAWRALGTALAQPAAILCISAHWYIPGCAVTASSAPRTIHDFGGFPAPLFAMQYPAPGSPALARRVAELLSPLPVALDEEWGLDHGCWAVLCHLFPAATIPVVQLAIDARQPPGFHYRLGQSLAPLRDEGVLIVGSGNLVHNLARYAWGEPGAAPYDWAQRFEDQVCGLATAGDDAAVVDYLALGGDAFLAVPTPEHYLPLLYILGLRHPADQVSFPVSGIDGGSVSMLALQLDSANA